MEDVGFPVGLLDVGLAVGASEILKQRKPSLTMFFKVKKFAVS